MVRKNLNFYRGLGSFFCFVIFFVYGNLRKRLMSFLTYQNITSSIQAFILFLKRSQQAQLLKREDVENATDQCMKIIAGMDTKELSPEMGALEFNNCVDRVNQLLISPYPVIATDSIENFTKHEILAFEHYLNQELRLNNLNLQDETALFNESVALWELVGDRVTPDDGLAELSLLIGRLNGFLPENQRYPFLQSDDESSSAPKK